MTRVSVHILGVVLLVLWSTIMVFVASPVLYLLTLTLPPDWKIELWACGLLAVFAILFPLFAAKNVFVRKGQERKEKFCLNLTALGLILPVLANAAQLYLLWGRVIAPLL